MKRAYGHSFRLPDPKPPQPAFAVASAAVHAVLGAVLLLTAGGTVARTVAVRFIDISNTSPSGARQFEMRLEPEAASIAASTGLAQPVIAPSDSSGGLAAVVAPRVVPIGVPPKELSRHDAVVGEAPVMGSSYGSGSLWVGPLEGRIGVIGPSSDPASHAARVDSAVQAVILALIDSMPPDSFAVAGMPSWVTEKDGKKWGIDGSWIYLGDVKIPAALMALLGFLPIPQGNYELAKQERELGAIREQIMRQAQQVETTTDIRRYIREIRERKDREREEARRLAEAQEAAMAGVKKDTIKPGEY
jgi:hypothetical protein